MQEHEDELYTAGQLAPPGRYVRVDVTGAREISLEDAGVLPASFDGHIATYVRLPSFDYLPAIRPAKVVVARPSRKVGSHTA